MTAVGLDIGHSAVKLSVTGPSGAPANSIFPAVVARALEISDEAESRRVALETIEIINGQRYIFGESATLQGAAPITGLQERWIYTTEHTALVLAAWKVAQRTHGAPLENPFVCLGLPTHLFTTQQADLKGLVSGALNIPAERIRVMPQAICPYHCLLLTPDGTPVSQASIAGESWGIIEVGHYTTDCCIVRRGRWIERASGTCAGVHVAAERLTSLLRTKGFPINLADAQEVLARGYVKHMGRRIDVQTECQDAISVVVDQATDTASRLFERWLSDLDAVLIAGGGAPFVFRALASKWPHARLADNPRFAIAEGLRRYGQAIESVRRAALAK